MGLSKDTLEWIEKMKKYSIKQSYMKPKIFIHTLYDKMKGLLDQNIVFQTKKIDDSASTYLKDTDFMSNEIKQNIQQNLHCCYELTHKKNSILYFTKKSVNVRLAKHMFQMIQIVEKLLNHDDYSQKIIFFHNDKKKRFPTTNKVVLGPNEVNSGVTYVNTVDQKNKKGCKIILYRKQEVLKVLVHELVHAHLLDIDMILWKDSVTFSKLFCTKYNVLLNEAYAEWYANIFNLVYINIVEKIGRKSLMNMYYHEVKYSIYISKKILHFYTISGVREIIKRGETCSILFPQQTNIVSYYILKNILLLQYDEVKKDINNIVEIIKKNMYLLDSIKNNYDYNDGNKSLRLCLYELKL
jgi:hypothetical protein